MKNIYDVYWQYEGDLRNTEECMLCMTHKTAWMNVFLMDEQFLKSDAEVSLIFKDSEVQ